MESLNERYTDLRHHTDEEDQIGMVNHPPHYTDHPSGIECIVITRHMNFNLGNAMKYIWRAGLKDKTVPIQDLEKAVWHLNDEIERRKLERACDQFHPGQSCRPGDNHPSVNKVGDPSAKNSQ